MDEIGRGTSTFDGLALAWAVATELAMQVKAMTLFATHYFELTRLADDHEGIVNVHLTAREHGDRIVFLHSVREGPASQSYGLQVARLAGLPHNVLVRARRHLERLEDEAERAESAQMNLFSTRVETAGGLPNRNRPNPTGSRRCSKNSIRIRTQSARGAGCDIPAGRGVPKKRVTRIGQIA